MNTFSDTVYQSSPQTQSKYEYWDDYVDHSMTDVQMMNDHVDQYAHGSGCSGNAAYLPETGVFEIEVEMKNKHCESVWDYNAVGVTPAQMRRFDIIDTLIAACIANVQLAANTPPVKPST